MKKKPTIYILANNKGGITKTTSTVNLAVSFAELFPGKKILILDIDGQGNVSQSFGINADLLDGSTMVDVFTGSATLDDIIFTPDKTNLDNLFIAPANIDLNILEFSHIMGNAMIENVPFILKNALKNMKSKFDYIFIDTPPGLGMMATNYLYLPARIIIPFEPEQFSFTGLIRLLEQTEDMKIDNPDLEVEGILLVKFMSRVRLHQDLKIEVERFAADKGYRIFNTIIPSSVKFANSIAYDQLPAILGEENKTAIVQTYKLLAQELIYLERNK